MPSKTRIIPATMATQHPDNASAPYWETDGDGFVSTKEELAECLSAFEELGVQEFMWDWEGKYADEAVIDRLFTQHYDFCKQRQLGKKTFLTFRIPNVWHEKSYSLPRALMVILTSEDFAKDLKFKNRPLFEIILPMTEKAEQLMYLQTAFQNLAQCKNATFSHYSHANADYLEVIPLVESVEGQMHIGKLLREYVRLHTENFKAPPPYIRPFLARSDPALASGLLATVLANKIALSEIAEFSKETGIATYPIIGVGSLPFRGGLSPTSIAAFVKQYAGVQTVTIQSAFRYDYPLGQVKKAVAELHRLLPQKKAVVVDKNDLVILETVIKRSTKLYQETLENLIADLTPFFEAVPRRRERKLHVGFLGYGRSLGKSKLPRAINFTAAFYSIGLPPECIGLGRALAQSSEAELAIIKKYYPTLAFDLERAGKFFAESNLRQLVKKNPAWKVIFEDIEKTKKILKISFGPKTSDEKKHLQLTEKLLVKKQSKEQVGALMVSMGKLRKSLG